MRLDLMIMSGVEDGLRLSYSTENGDGQLDADNTVWKISVGRSEESDICLRNDTFSSRQHAYICWKNDQWWLEDCGSTNGVYVEHADSDVRVDKITQLELNQLFRVGHTWMQIEADK